MCWWKECFLSKNNPRYYYVSFSWSIEPSKGLRYKEGELMFDQSQEVKDFWFVVLNSQTELVK